MASQHNRVCLECDGKYTSRQYNAGFCGSGCRQRFNNRRALRGSILYDLAMLEANESDPRMKAKLGERKEDALRWFIHEDAKAGRRRSYKDRYAVMSDTLYIATAFKGEV